VGSRGDETSEESLRGIYYDRRSSRCPPSSTPSREEGRTPQNLAAPTPVQKHVNPGVSVEESEVVPLADKSGWEYGAYAGAYANLGRRCGVCVGD
jgi:hypothetical protein